MMKRLLTLLIVLWPAIAIAQVTVQSSGTNLTFNKCPSGSFLDGSFTNNVANCVAAPSGGGGTYTAGQCINIASNVISVSALPVTKTGAYTFATGDNCGTFIYNSTTAGTFSLGQSGSAAFPKGWGVVVKVRGTGALTLGVTSGVTSVLWGCPVTYAKNQDVIVQADDGGNWALINCQSAVVNPFPYQ